jgi:hypothetical protein
MNRAVARNRKPGEREQGVIPGERREVPQIPFQPFGAVEDVDEGEVLRVGVFMSVAALDHEHVAGGEGPRHRADPVRSPPAGHHDDLGEVVPV